MGYYIDLASISLEEYKTKMASAWLPPSRMILKQWLDERFDFFTNAGIKNLKELKNHLSKNDKIAEWQKVSLFSGDYLKILLRELNSMLPKPNKISEFSGISPDTVAKLEKAGIRDTLKLFDKVKDTQSRKKLSDSTGIDQMDLLELTKLTDLSRIKWVGHAFARMLVDIGTDTVEKAAGANPVELHQKINQLNREKNLYKGQIGLNDIKIFVDAAKEVPREIEY